MTNLKEQTDHRGERVAFSMLDIAAVTMVALPPEDYTIGEDGEPSVTPRPRDEIKREYIAGPMRGYDQWNFPAFDAARNKRLALGIQVISPADLDRARGITEDTTDFDADAFTEAMRIDVYALLQCTGIFMLRGWEGSTGARFELAVAEKIGLDITFDDDASEGSVLINDIPYEGAGWRE